MSVKVHLNNLHIAPRKVRLVAGLIKGLEIKAAVGQLKFVGKRAAQPMLKLLNSAVAAAKNNSALTEKDLYITNVLVDSGQMMKRSRPRAHGRAFPIRKHTSHITIILATRTENQKNSSRSDDQKLLNQPEVDARKKKSAKLPGKKIKSNKQKSAAGSARKSNRSSIKK